METLRLGKTNLVVTKNGFGALPVQRVDTAEGVRLLRMTAASITSTPRAFTPTARRKSDLRCRTFVRIL